MSERHYSQPIPASLPGSWGLVAITLLGLALRLLRLDFQPLWWDEGYSVYFATKDLVGLTLGTAADIHPPFYYYLLHFWIMAFSPGQVPLRLFSVAVGTLTIPAIYRVGRPLAGREAALLAAFLLAISPLHVYYSQEVRMYALATLLGLGSVYFWVRLAQAKMEQGKKGMGAWIGYVLFTTLSLYTLYYAAFIPLFQTAALFIFWRRYRSLLGRWLLVQVIVALLYLPWILLAGGILVQYVSAKMVVEARTPLSLPTYLADHLVAFSLGHLPGRWDWLGWGSVLLVGLAALGMAPGNEASSEAFNGHSPTADHGPHGVQTGPIPGVWWLLLWLAIPLTAGFVLNILYPFAPFGYQRFLLFALPAFLLLAGRGLRKMLWGDRPVVSVMEKRPFGQEAFLRTSGWPLSLLARLLLSATLLLTTVSLGLFYLVPRYPKDDYRPLIAQIATLSHPHDVVLTVFPWQVGYLHAYFPPPLPHVVEVPTERWSRDRSQMERDLDSLMATGPRVWFPAHQKHGAILERQIEDYLAKTAYPIRNEWFGDTRLYFYISEEPAVMKTTAVSFDRQVELLAYALGPQTVESAWGVVQVTLRWRLVSAPNGTYVVHLRLSDDLGRTWGQRDSEPLAGRYPFHLWPLRAEVMDRHGLLVPPGTPPGAYQVHLSLYDKASGEPLTILNPQGLALGPELSLGKVMVVRPAVLPPLRALGFQRYSETSFGGSLRLLGYNLIQGTYRPGDRLQADLFWQAMATPPQAYIVSVQMQDGTGRPWAVTETPDLGAGYTFDRLIPGEVIRSQYELLLPPDAPAGDYRLTVSLLNPGDKRRLPVPSGDQVNIATVRLSGRAHVYAVPPIQYPVQAYFGGVAELLGYDLSLVAGGGRLPRVVVTLYWQAQARTETAYKVFVHVVDRQDVIWGQRDATPQGGNAPTTAWLPGEVISDTYAIDLKPEATAGEYLLDVGMYDPASGVRLPVRDRYGQPLGDHLSLTILNLAE